MKWCAVILLGCASQTVGLEAPDIDPPQPDFASGVDAGQADFAQQDLASGPDLRQPSDMIVCGESDMGTPGWTCGCGLGAWPPAGGEPCCVGGCAGCDPSGCGRGSTCVVNGFGVTDTCVSCGRAGYPCCIGDAGHYCAGTLACTPMSTGGDICQ